MWLEVHAKATGVTRSWMIGVSPSEAAPRWPESRGAGRIPRGGEPFLESVQLRHRRRVE